MRVLVSNDASSGGDSSYWFAVIGAQRTGTNILREILNTNEQIAMLGEVLTPSPAPAHWDNFCRSLPAGRDLPVTSEHVELLLDQYFRFVQHRIRNHWEGRRKRTCHAMGVDIKYNQLRHIAPTNWDPASPPFIVAYLRSRGAILIHTVRNPIHCAISTLIASQRNVWHNYDGALIDRSYHINVVECLSYARTIRRDRAAFVESTRGGRIVTCRYEPLIDEIERAGSKEDIPEGPGPLCDISKALGSRFKFRYDRHLQKAINVPYSRLLSNYNALVERLNDSEFSALAATLE